MNVTSDPICNERGIPESECPPHCHHGRHRAELAAAWERGYDARGQDIANEGLTYTTLADNPYAAPRANTWEWDDCGHHPEWVNRFDRTATCNHPDHERRELGCP